MSEDFIFRVESLKHLYPVGTGFFRSSGLVLRAVNDISFEIRHGEILGLAGESGCGKSTTGRLLLGLEKPTSGKILYKGLDMATFGEGERRKFHTEVSAIFQDPFASLNPRKTVLQTLGIPLVIHKRASSKDEVRKRSLELLSIVGLEPTELFADRYPHELSGGQRQRVCIARAIALTPHFICADEPVSSLDVSIRGQIVRLFVDLQKKLGLVYLFISHDLAVIRSICDRVIIMYLGSIVEEGPVNLVMDKPLHPYTSALIAATPIPDPKVRARTRNVGISGEVPSAIHPPSGCAFHTRCPYRMEVCERSSPRSIDAGSGHKAACHLLRT